MPLSYILIHWWWGCGLHLNLHPNLSLMFCSIGEENTGSSVSFHLEGLDIVDLRLFKEINSGTKHFLKLIVFL